MQRSSPTTIISQVAVEFLRKLEGVDRVVYIPYDLSPPPELPAQAA